MRTILASCASLAALVAPGWAASLDDVAFLEGQWRGGDSFVFEEVWSAPMGGVMTGMARGVAFDETGAGALRVLEYIVISEEGDDLVMRFQHFRADYSTWEEDPIILKLTEAGEGSARFEGPEGSTVPLIHYSIDEDGGLVVDVITVEDGVEDGFTLQFERVE